MKRAAILCLSFIVVVPALVFSQQESTTESVFSTETEGDSIFEKYLEESRKISEEFTPLYNRLKEEAFINVDNLKIPDIERWEREYYTRLFERSKQTMRQITGYDDYLSAWEHNIPQKIIAAENERRLINSNINDDTFRSVSIPYSVSSDGMLSLLSVYTLAVVDERRASILNGTAFEDSENGAKIRETRPPGNPWTLPMGLGESPELRKMFKRMKRWILFPPRTTSFVQLDASWHVMAIYSFRNERSENLLFTIINDPNVESGLADWAVYYLALSPDSSRFLPDVKKEFSLRIKSFRRAYPQKSSVLFTPDGPSLKSSGVEYYETVSELSRPENKDAYVKFEYARRLLSLKRALECNERIPENEKERFEIVRRESALFGALSRKGTVSGPRISVFLRKGEERFEIYLSEYFLPAPLEIFWEEDEEGGFEDRANGRR
ncbi:MAG: hypothetical protein IJM54_07510 [Thermoguttaceae bacterium]|nr:hypothetical protein [Thermoguttaceae bacterium]